MNKPLPSRDEIATLYHSPLLELVFQAASLHRQHHPSHEMQVCTLQSIKTGGCSEDCGYCAQSVHYETQLERSKMQDAASLLALARQAKEAGSTRFCMGSAGRAVKDEADFEQILQMVKGVSSLGLEVCCTLGQLQPAQAKRLKQAGLYAYNHNLDTGEKYYSKVVSTHSYQERLDTINEVAEAGISLCCGGILGMGEAVEDRIDLLFTLSRLDPAPESVPVNVLVPIPGTPMAEQEKIPTLELVRMIATARLLLPKTMIRLAAGRESLSQVEQAFCFLAGANSIFSGDKLLTTPGPDAAQDAALFQALQLTPQKPYSRQA